MHDPFAPVIEGFDLSGLVNPYSFHCTPFYTEGDNGGTLMDGTTVHDILAEKVRLSWTFNVLSMEQYTALTAALNSGESPDTVNAYAFEPTKNAIIFSRFHVSQPEFRFVMSNDRMMCFTSNELVLEEADRLAWFVVTPPNKTTYEHGDTLDLTGLTVTQYYKNGTTTDITAQCTFSPANGTELLTEGHISLTVTLPGGFEWVLDLYITVTPPVPRVPIASGDRWTLYDDGLLDIYFVGEIPDSFLRYRFPQNLRNQIRTVKIRNSVTSIGWDAFEDCVGLTSVSIGNSVTHIKNAAFAHCSGLTSVTIPDSVTYLGNSAFGGCSGLTNVSIPDSVTHIGGHAFSGCSGLTSVTIPDSVTYLGEYVFYYCSGLTSVSIGNSVTSILDSAFNSCSSLTSVTIGNSVTSIGYMAFSDCSCLTRIDVTSGNTAYTSENGILFNKSKTTLVCYPAGKADTVYTIPDSVTSIEDFAFLQCSGLTSVTIGNSVTSIGYMAFGYCSGLTSMTIPDSVTYIGGYAFFGCGKLSDVYYSGTEAQRNTITIYNNNTPLTSATWHYESTGPDS